MGLGSSAQKQTVDMDGQIANLVKEKINNNCVMIFSKTWCPYCKTAKQAFDQLKVEYEVMELDKQENGSDIQDILHEMTGARTVPRVFVGGKFIGGSSEVDALLRSGELKNIIDGCK